MATYIVYMPVLLSDGEKDTEVKIVLDGNKATLRVNKKDYETIECDFDIESIVNELSEDFLEEIIKTLKENPEKVDEVEKRHDEIKERLKNEKNVPDFKSAVYKDGRKINPLDALDGEELLVSNEEDESDPELESLRLLDKLNEFGE
ncbi:hypothetical protein [Caldanaerobacter subterraneus]|uniref:Uncharacterized protein n=1 Tax=Caldanaerobacter subterraneus TaxID=911092 RepID=A0A7Y2L677_9THEO|nr:hypothetical protein [Caldanaerobacter subterraneus]NNG66395.1 hypothetical protein [Caldanaerobacter subterraneus]